MTKDNIIELLQDIIEKIEDIGVNDDIIFGCETCSDVRREASDIVWEYIMKTK